MSATPVSPLAPDTCAVEAPGGSATRIAESPLIGLFHANAPTEAAVAEICGLPAQPLSLSITAEPEKSLSWGSGSVPAIPNGARAGPEARMRTVLDVEPPITKPAIRIVPPVPTWARVEMLTSRGVAGVYVPAAVAS